MGIAALCSVNILFDLFTSLGFIPVPVFRVLVFRYLGMLCVGILMYHYSSSVDIRKTLLILMLGFILTVINHYVTNHVVFKNWTSTALPVSVYAGAFVMLFKI